MDGEIVVHLYIEADDPPVEGNTVKEECIAISGNVQVTLKKGDRLPEFISPEKAEFLVREVYDRLPLGVDRTDGSVVRDMIVDINGRLTIKLLKGDRLMLLPVEGFAKTLIAGVGNIVRRGDAFAAVTTRKGEVHYLRPPKDSIIVFIDEISEAPSYVYYMLPIEEIGLSTR